MKVILRWLARAAFVGMTGALAAMARPHPPVVQDCSLPEQVGTCPPLANGDHSCFDACVQADFPDGGSCVAGCCTCFLR